MVSPWWKCDFKEFSLEMRPNRRALCSDSYMTVHSFLALRTYLTSNNWIVTIFHHWQLRHCLMWLFLIWQNILLVLIITCPSKIAYAIHHLWKSGWKSMATTADENLQILAIKDSLLLLLLSNKNNYVVMTGVMVLGSFWKPIYVNAACICKNKGYT